jgi:aspartate dehydrogenase
MCNYLRRVFMKAGLIGCGNMGGYTARAFDSGLIDGELVAVYDIIQEKAVELSAGLKCRPRVAKSFDELLEGSDFIVEAASQQAVREYTVKALENGKDVLIMSSGALLDEEFYEKIIKTAGENNRRVYVPSGALGGLDAVKAASIAGIKEAVLKTTKPPKSLRNVKYLEDMGIDVDKLAAATVLYEGPALEAVKLFPKNVNVSAILSLAGIGPEKTRVVIVCDPDAETNTHEVVVKGASGVFESRASNVPSPENPGTSYLACLSIVQALKQITENLKKGT